LLSKQALDQPVLVLKDTSGQVLERFPAQITDQAWSPFSHYYAIDFTTFQTPGRYYLELAGAALRSPDFIIAPYPSWYEDVVGFIRTQRCGFNSYTQTYCHQLDGLSFFGHRTDSVRIDATGGWHDAGDQLKYLITSSNTTARMLMGYLRAPGQFVDDYNARGLVGSNDLPDILDEAKWGLEWILKLHPGPDELYHQVADIRQNLPTCHCRIVPNGTGAGRLSAGE